MATLKVSFAYFGQSWVLCVCVLSSFHSSGKFLPVGASVVAQLFPPLQAFHCVCGSVFCCWWASSTSCSVAQTQSCPTLCCPVDCITPGFPVLHYLPELAHTHAHRVGDAIQPSHPLLPPSPPALSLSQQQGLFQWVSSSHQVAKVLEFQHQSFQWIFRVDFL